MRLKKIQQSELYGFPGVATYEYEEATSIYGVYSKDNELVGTFAVKERDSGCYLYNLITHPEYRGGGVGGFMMRRIIKKRGTALGFNVSAFNTTAIAMYLKYGFKISAINPTQGKITFYYGG